MSGHIRRRGANSWQLKFDLGVDPLTGKRRTRYHSFKGTKREAEVELTRLLGTANRGDYVDSSRVTLKEYLDRWQSDWVHSNLSAKSAERYGELIRTHVCPKLGHLALQKVRPANLATFYSELLKSGRKGPGADTGLAACTVAYIHRILHRAFGHAVKWGLISLNPTESVDPPRVNRSEVAILSEVQVKSVLRRLRGQSIYVMAALGLATGMRRGELLALRWKDVNLETRRIGVERSLEQTKAGLRFKEPKTKHGRRSISISASIVGELQAHRRAQAEQRLKLGLGKETSDSLVFRNLEGGPLQPNSVTTEWRRVVKALALPKITLHGWRHTHASQLIASGMDVLTISRRLGHGSPSITLDVYGHLFHSNDDRAAAVFEKAFGGVLTKPVQK